MISHPDILKTLTTAHVEGLNLSTPAPSRRPRASRTVAAAQRQMRTRRRALRLFSDTAR
jgi:hypothetical protein